MNNNLTLSRQTHRRIVIALSLILVGLMGAAYYWGGQIKISAKRDWHNHAAREVEGITNDALHSMSFFQSQLRGLSALFYASIHVSKDEFVDAITVLEGVNVSSPLGSWGLIQINTPKSGGNNHYRIIYSTENIGLLSEGTDLAPQNGMEATISRALSKPDTVVTGNAFIGPNGNRQVLFAVTVPHIGHRSVLFLSLNLDYFFKDLKSLHIPEGLNLRLSEAQQGQDRLNEGTPIIRHALTPQKPVQTIHLHTESGGIQWKFHWDVLPNYLGGPATALGNSIQWGGIVLGLLFYVFLMYLSKENFRVNQQVQERTSELNWASKAAEKANNMLRDLSLRDGLTNISNRRRFDEFLDQEWKSAIRHKGELSIILIDIDFFKLYNDTLGHTEGDECLKKVAFILQGRIERATDLVARYGGEEFICVLPNTSLAGAIVIGNKLRQAIADANIAIQIP